MLSMDWREGDWREDQAPKKPTACSAMTITVPDIMLQNPARMVASMTNSKRRRTKRRARKVLRMMMKGAAKIRNGTAAKADGRGPRCSRRKLAGRLVRYW